MKRLPGILSVLVTILLFACGKIAPLPHVEGSMVSAVNNDIAWEGKNEFANYLAAKARWHFTNVEFEKAYVLFEEAVNIDSTLFASHVMLGFLSHGATKDHHLRMAKKFAEDKNETSKLFVSLLELPDDTTDRDSNREIWAKMHGLTDGAFVHMYYAVTRKDSLERLAEIDKVIALLEKNNMNAAPAYNQKGYTYDILGQWQKGVQEIEKYVALYPAGYNPVDSRAEFYLFSGDTARAIKEYEKVLEIFPYAQNTRNSINTLSKK